MKPIFAEQRNAQASPNSAGSPTRPVGEFCARSWTNFIDRPIAGTRRRLKTAAQAIGQERALQNIVDDHVVLRDLSGEAGDDTGQSGTRAIAHAQFRDWHDFTEADVMLTMRPNLRSIIPSTTDLIRKIGVSMLASTALIKSSRLHSRKSPGADRRHCSPECQGSGRRRGAAARPASVVMSRTAPR